VNASELCPVGRYHIALGHCCPAVNDAPEKSSFLIRAAALSFHIAIDARVQYLLLLVSSQSIQLK